MLSVHPTALAKDASGKLLASAYASGWETPGSSLMADHPRTTGREQLNTADPHVVAKLIREFAWSPIIWDGNVRKADKFASALWCALDFDEPGYSLSECLDDVTSAGLMHVLGTTKSHGQAKDSAPACDRFRLLLRFEGVVTDRRTFERAMRAAMEVFPHADKSCKDAARFYFPCREIVSASQGYPLVLELDEAQDAGPAPPAKTPAVAPARDARAPRQRPPSHRPRISRWLEIIEVEGIHVQRNGKSRHDQMRDIVPELRRAYGYDEHQCFEFLRSRFPSERPDAEIREAIQWSFNHISP